jgi:hypothetical protein
VDGSLEGVALFDVLVDHRDDALLRLVPLATEDDLAGGLGHEISEAPKVAFCRLLVYVSEARASVFESELRGRFPERLSACSARCLFVVLRSLKMGFFLPGRHSDTCPRGHASRPS